jgi:uncharacterized Zn finger protein
MDSLNLSSEKLDVECDCGRSASRTIAQWRRNPTLECPQCGTTIKVDVSDFDRSVREVDRGLERLDRQLGKLGN